MQTLYVDVYFLINFTIDFLALYFAALIAKTPTGIVRLLLGALAGSSVAILNLFIEIEWLGYAALLLGFIIMICISTRRVSIYRRFKLAFCFSIIEMLLGGLVYLMYDFLESRLLGGSDVGGGENRGLLILAVLVLISIGLFKCLISIFSFSTTGKMVEVEIRMNGRRVVAEALVDTGNLARDPFDMRAVMLVCPEIAEQLLGKELCGIYSHTEASESISRRIRLIPVTFGKDRRLLTGFRPDAVYVTGKRGREEIDVVVAIDKEGGKYGDADILMPSVAIRDVC